MTLFERSALSKILAGLILMVPVLAACAPAKVCIRGHCYEVEIARTNDELSRGLMYRKQMNQDKGMVFFLRSPGRHGFWMKNTLISLDMIWLDGEKRIVTIAAAVPPCEKDPCLVVYPTADAEYVLELNAGRTELDGINVGDKAEFHFETAP